MDKVKTATGTGIKGIIQSLIISEDQTIKVTLEDGRIIIIRERLDIGYSELKNLIDNGKGKGQVVQIASNGNSHIIKLVENNIESGTITRKEEFGRDWFFKNKKRQVN